MTVLGGNLIGRRLNEIVEAGSFSKDSIDFAAYNLRLDDEEIIISGQTYHKDHRYWDQKNSGRIVLPARKISIISTIERLTMPRDLVGRCGITFKWAKEGLIPLFGPQIDPGYQGKFYAVVYNISEKDLELPKGEPIVKMELHEVDDAVVSTPHQYSVFDLDASITERGEERLVKLEHEVDETKRTLIEERARLQEAVRGYRDLTIFGLFLVAASILGVALTSLLTSADKLTALIGNADLAVFLFVSILAMLVTVAIVLILGLRREK